MTKFARLDADGVVLETCDDAALATHEPLLRATFAPCPDATAPGARLFGGVWTPPAAPAALPLPLLTPMTLYLAFTPQERIAIKASQDEMVKEFWATYQLSVQLDKPTDPNLVSVREAIEYLATPAVAILASPDRIADILNGAPQ